MDPEERLWSLSCLFLGRKIPVGHLVCCDGLKVLLHVPELVVDHAKTGAMVPGCLECSLVVVVVVPLPVPVVAPLVVVCQNLMKCQVVAYELPDTA